MTKIPTLIHNGTTVISPGTYDDVWDNVIGHGTYVVSAGASLDFLYGVGGGQTIELSNQSPNGVWGASSLLLNHPADFHAAVDLTYKAPPAGAPAMEQSHVDLMLLTRAVDSYSYKNDLLKLWSSNKVVDTLKLDVHDPYGFTVQAQTTGGWMFISANTPTLHGIDAVHGHPPAMAVHST
jgi:hypothetical protein